MSLLLLIGKVSPLLAAERPYVIGRLECQLGNNLFQIATTCAHAWDHRAEPCFPDLATKLTEGMPTNYEHVFFRLNSKAPLAAPQYEWRLPTASNFCYQPIPFYPNMVLSGTFQSEKFFAHHRTRLLELFAPREDDLEYIKNKYGTILSYPLTVGIQLRWFGCQQDAPWWDFLVQYGYDYLEQAMSLFPEETLFIVSSNDLNFIRQNLPIQNRNILVLEGEPYYIDFFILTMCKHNIISNSTFGWWTAWLNQNPDKIVIAPHYWVDPKWDWLTPVKDVWPDNWIKIDAKWGKPQDPMTSFRKY